MNPSTTAQRSPFDEITAELRRLRTAAGEPSYAELVQRVIALRTARGVPPWEARLGRTTVYDAFRPGRRLIDPALVGDLVRVLGGAAQDAADMLERCEQARRLSRSTPPTAAPPAPRIRPAGPALRPSMRAALLVACLVLNLAGRVFVLRTHVPLYLDMVGTAIAAISVGPWAAVLVGVSTSVAGAAVDGWISVPFAPVEVVGAIVWGYGVRRFGFGRSVPRFFVLNLLAALCCTVIAVPIIVWLDHGITGDGADLMTRSMQHMWHSLLAAVLSQNLITSIADKLISGFCALAVCEALPLAPDGARDRLALRSGWRACTARLALLPGR